MNTNIIYNVKPIIICVMFCLVTWGCSSSEKGYYAKQRYVLDIDRKGEAVSPGGTKVLRVKRFDISNRFTSKEFVYRIGEVKYESDFYNEYFTSPQSLITEEVEQWLISSGIFAHVTSPGSDTSADISMEGDIKALYGDYSNKTEPAAVMEICFMLTEEIDGRNSAVFDKFYSVKTPLASNSAADLVKGFNDSLINILSQLEHDLVQSQIAGVPD